MDKGRMGTHCSEGTAENSRKDVETAICKAHPPVKIYIQELHWWVPTGWNSQLALSAVIQELYSQLALSAVIQELYSLGQWNWVADVTESQFDQAWSQKNAAQTSSDSGVGPEKELFPSL